MQKVIFVLIFTVLINFSKGQAPVANAIYSVGDSITDFDGNKYPTVIIHGKQWMTENLRVTHFNNGAEIEVFQDGKKYGPYETSGEVQTPAYCWYKGKKDTDETRDRGALYNWYTVETEKVCPVGWHVSTVQEWEIIEKLADPKFVPTKEILESYNTGEKLRAKRGWKTGFLCYGPGSDDFGLSIMPGGYRSGDGKYCSGIGNDAIYWTNRDEYLPTALELSQKGKGSGIGFLDKVSGSLEKAANTLNTVAELNGQKTQASAETIKEKSREAVSQKITSSITHNNNSKGYFYSIRCVKN